MAHPGTPSGRFESGSRHHRNLLQMSEGRLNGAGYRNDEFTGYGSNWPVEPLMTTSTTDPLVGERVELSTYTLLNGISRQIIGQRVNGTVRLADWPQQPRTGRNYLIDYGLEQDGYTALQALIQDYLEHSSRHGQIPAAERPLEALARPSAATKLGGGQQHALNPHANRARCAEDD